jgi:hypothetical protein
MHCAIAILIAVAIVVGLLVLISVPDIARYVRISRM